MEGSARGLGAGQEKGALSSCLVGRGGTFRTGQRLLAQSAEAEVLVEAPGLGLFQHLWAPVHSMQLEEAPDTATLIISPCHKWQAWSLLMGIMRP